jgi:hypothetical protein
MIPPASTSRGRCSSLKVLPKRGNAPPKNGRLACGDPFDWVEHRGANRGMAAQVQTRLPQGDRGILDELELLNENHRKSFIRSDLTTEAASGDKRPPVPSEREAPRGSHQHRSDGRLRSVSMGLDISSTEYKRPGECLHVARWGNRRLPV